MSEYIEPSIRGLLLGTAVAGFSFFMDISISLPSYYNLRKQPRDYELYTEGWKAILTNMCIVNTPMYAFTIVHCVKSDLLVFSNIEPTRLLFLTMFHNLLYYYVHYFMHTNQVMMKIHGFHHKFDKVMLPSVGNAVSKGEYIIAYASPLVLGSWIFQVNEITLMSSAFLISLFNLFIHCRELRDVTWVPNLVSPNKHITHHEVKTRHFAAPLFDFDEFMDVESYK